MKDVCAHGAAIRYKQKYIQIGGARYVNTMVYMQSISNNYVVLQS